MTIFEWCKANRSDSNPLYNALHPALKDYIIRDLPIDVTLPYVAIGDHTIYCNGRVSVRMENGRTAYDGNVGKYLLYGADMESAISLDHYVNHIRDNGGCQQCGTKKRLTVHHKTPQRKGRDNSRENVLVLCEPCHEALEYITQDIYAELWEHDINKAWLMEIKDRVPFLAEAYKTAERNEGKGPWRKLFIYWPDSIEQFWYM